MWDFSYLTRDQIHTPCIGRQSLNHWTTREAPETTTDHSPFPVGLAWATFALSHLQVPEPWTNVLITIPDSTLMYRKLNWTATLNFYFSYGTLSSNQDYAKSMEKTVTMIRWQMTLRGIPHGTGLGHQMTPSLGDLSALVLSWTSTPSHYPCTTANSWLPSHTCNQIPFLAGHCGLSQQTSMSMLGPCPLAMMAELPEVCVCVSFRLALDRFEMSQLGNSFSLKKKKMFTSFTEN